MMLLRYIILPLLAARLYSLALYAAKSHTLPINIFLIRGLYSDLIVGLAMGLLCALLPHRVKSKAFSVILILLVALNAEHIRINESNADFAFAHLALTRDFIMGSVLSLGSFINATAIAFMSVAMALVISRINITLTDIKPRLPVYAILASVLAFLPISGSVPKWMQLNLIEDNIRRAASRTLTNDGSGLADPLALKRFKSRDLDGRPVIAYPEGDLNVLLVLVEGIGYDRSISTAMPSFRKLAGLGMTFDSFVSLQRQTNRGLYAILCGDYPNLITAEAKSDYVAQFGPTVKCLPQVFRDNGYHNVFMQSARLGYMQKDKFSRQLGFNEILGASDHKNTISMNSWGVDDSTLYSNALNKIMELRQVKKKWTMTLLSSSTHHPYNVPGVAVPSDYEALQFADKTLREFINSLYKLGVFRDTVVVLTSDESAFAEGSGLARMMSLNHAPLVVFVPGTSPMTNSGLFTQADLLISLADLMGFDMEGLSGRSIFRQYRSARSILFGNSDLNKAYALLDEKVLLSCNGRMDCRQYMLSSGMFGNEAGESDVEKTTRELVSNALQSNELTYTRRGKTLIFSERKTEHMGSRLIVGDLNFTLTGRSEARWKYVIKALDPITVKIQAYGQPSSGEPSTVLIFQESFKLKSGQEMNFSKSFIPPPGGLNVKNYVSVEAASPSSRFLVNEISITREPPE